MCYDSNVKTMEFSKLCFWVCLLLYGFCKSWLLGMIVVQLMFDFIVLACLFCVGWLYVCGVLVTCIFCSFWSCWFGVLVVCVCVFCGIVCVC